MKKNYKAEFIAEHGQEKWDLANDYRNHGNRSPEATNAKRLYDHYQHGLNRDTYTIYQVTEFGKVVYIGLTGQDPRSRWSCHKSTARSLYKACPLHRAMHEISSDHKNFPAYRFAILHTTTDKVAAEALEIAEIAAHGTNKDGYNHQRGGGNKAKKHLKNDAMIALVEEGFPL